MTKSSFGVMDAQHKFAPALCFRLLMENFFDGIELMWNYNEKSHEKGHMAGVGGTVKTSSSAKSIRALLRLIHLSSFIKPY